MGGETRRERVITLTLRIKGVNKMGKVDGDFYIEPIPLLIRHNLYENVDTKHTNKVTKNGRKIVMLEIEIL